MNILAALQESTADRGTKRCKLQRTLDDIPPDAENRAELLAAVADEKKYPANRLTMSFSRLKLPVSASIIREHRATRCACYR